MIIAHLISYPQFNILNISYITSDSIILLINDITNSEKFHAWRSQCDGRGVSSGALQPDPFSVGVCLPTLGKFAEYRKLLIEDVHKKALEIIIPGVPYKDALVHCGLCTFSNRTFSKRQLSKYSAVVFRPLSSRLIKPNFCFYLLNLSPYMSLQPITSRPDQLLLYLLTNQIVHQGFFISNWQNIDRLTLKMASEQVVETSVANNSPSQDSSSHPNDYFQSSRFPFSFLNLLT